MAGFTVPAFSGTVHSPRLLADGSGSRIAAMMPSSSDDVVIGSSSFDPPGLSSSESPPPPLDGIVDREWDRRSSSAAIAAAAAAASLLLTSSPAWADSPDWGLFEGRTGSLLHPVAMISMFALSASTALLGFQWKRQRTLGDEISSLKKTIPDLGGAASAVEALRAAESAEVVDASYVRSLRGGVETEAKVAELTKERKELANAGPKDKHFNQGALLLFVGTAFAIEVGFSSFSLPPSCCPFLFASRGLLHMLSFASLCLASSLSLSHPPHPVPPIRPGTAQHVRPRGEALPRTAPVRRSRTRRAMVPRCRHGPAHAEGERRGAGGPRGCEPRRDRPLRLAGHDRPAHIVQGPRVDEVALRRGERLLITRECANSLG